MLIPADASSNSELLQHHMTQKKIIRKTIFFYFKNYSAFVFLLLSLFFISFLVFLLSGFVFLVHMPFQNIG